MMKPYSQMTRWERRKWHANRGDYNLQALMLFASLPGALLLIAELLS